MAIVLASVIRGWLQYHAVPDNMRRLDQFVDEVTKLWLRNCVDAVNVAEQHGPGRE